jgi:hypothetical protein
MGKFEGNSDPTLAEYLYELSLDGCESIGSVQEGSGWYGLVEYHRSPEVGGWYILHEDSQGFVDIYRGPSTEQEIQAVWHELLLMDEEEDEEVFEITDPTIKAKWMAVIEDHIAKGGT